jgi:hypothetical protein
MNAGKSSEWATKMTIVVLDALHMVRAIKIATNVNNIIWRDVIKLLSTVSLVRYEVVSSIRPSMVEYQRVEMI